MPLAWLTVRSDLPGRRAWATLATLPLVMPSYIAAYVFVAVLRPKGLLQELLAPLGVQELPPIYGFLGAWLVLTLCTYPLVLHPAARGAAAPGPVARGGRAGHGPLAAARSFAPSSCRSSCRRSGPAACSSRSTSLSDFGAVAILRFDSFTREIYIAFQSAQRTEAAALGMVLVLVMLVLFALYARVRGARALHRSSPGTQRPRRRCASGAGAGRRSRSARASSA